jgi:hypothetical protein
MRDNTHALFYNAQVSDVTTYFAPADRRAIVLPGVPADHTYTFEVRAYRKVDSDINATGVILSNSVATTPYQPLTAPVYHGDIQGTIQGRDSLEVVVNLENIASDAVLSTTEKPALILSYNQAQSDWNSLHAKAQSMGLFATEDDAASAAWTALGAYLSSLTPAWNDTTQHTPINPTTFQSKWASFYAAIADLNAAINGQKGDTGDPGPAGPTVSLVGDGGSFDFMDGVPFNASQVINLTATLQNSTETIDWSTSPAVTLTAGVDGNHKSLSLANFGANTQVVITATGHTSGAKASIMLKRNDQTTPNDSIIPDGDWTATVLSNPTPVVNPGDMTDPDLADRPWRTGGNLRFYKLGVDIP